MNREDPVRGRIVMSPKRLVLVGDDHKVTIPT
ncbi:MAG: CheF family chemotaxis protein, partial [Haloplanus sp.]